MNGHAAADKDEANCGMHHSLREQMGQLVDRERVLIGENDQLRAQLVEMKEQEKKKYDDLMVQYNMKREHRENGGLDRDGMTVKEEIKEEIKEDDGLDNEGTSNNQVTVKTEWDDEEVKVEIKEEDEDDEDSGWDRCVVKKEEVEDQIEDWVKREIKEEEGDGEMVEVKEEIKEEDEEEEDGEMVEEEETQINVTEKVAESNQGGEDECGSVEKASMDTTRAHQTGQSQNASNAMSESDDQTVTQSGGDLFSPSTSTGLGSNRTALNQQATASTGRNGNKRKQQTSKRSVKRSKKTIVVDDGEDGEDGDNIANEDREESKVKVLYLNCTESNCNVQFNSIDHLHHHLSTLHQLPPFQCFAMDCNSRSDNPMQIRAHIKLNHPQDTRFLCPVCHKEFDSQHKAYIHSYQSHLNGQFKCNFVSDCAEVANTRYNMKVHQQTKHHSQWKRFNCTQPGCTASFAFKDGLKRHELTHLNTNQFHCNWPHCSKQCKQRSNLVRHIRTQHFGLPESMKAQKEKNIVDLRDPNEYVRVVVDE